MKYQLLSTIYYQNQQTYQQEYQTRYNSPAAVHLDFAIHEQPTFYLSTAEVTSLTSDIFTSLRLMEKALADLPGAAQSFYSQTCLIDEIILSNDIEHVYSSRRDITEVLAVLDAPPSEHTNMRLFGMVQKYRRLSAEQNTTAIETPEDIRRIYDELILPEITKDSEKPDGLLFRTDAVNVISPTGKVKHTGVYGEENITQSIKKALAILNQQPVSLVNIAIFHYLFGYIHPFYEGNGRLSRFISSQLLSDFLHPLVACRLSFAIKNDLSAYYNAFDQCNDPKNKGDLTPFVLMFLRVIKSATLSLIKKIADGCEKLIHFSDILSSIELSDKHHAFVYLLIQQALFAPEEPFTIYDISQISHLSVPNCRTTLKQLPDNIPLLLTKSGHTHLYSIDLDKFESLNQPAAF